MANPNRSTSLPNPRSYVSHLYRSVYASEPVKPLPSSWNSKDRSLSIKFSQSSLTISCTADAPASRHNSVLELPTVKADHPVPLNAGIYYFETNISSFTSNCTILIGVTSRRASKFSGWDSSSFGFHSDGSLYHHISSTPFGPKFCEKDIIGCGVDLITKSLFYTRNGRFIGKAFEGKLPASNIPDLYPAIALDGQGCRVTTNFGDQPFFYPFKHHITEEREAHENKLIESLTMDFINVKMRDLVAGYLVHHGYIDSARTFSRWTQFWESGSSAKKTRNEASVEDNEGSAEDGGSKGEDEEPEPLLGFASMQHRRRLRNLCHRCQYGRVINTLSALYPSIVERYPELVLQLRCHQLIEMMYRHSEQRSSQTLSTSDSKLQCPVGGSRKRPCTTNAAAFCRTSESAPTTATCDDDRSVGKYLHAGSLHDVFNQAHFPTSGSSEATSCDAMDIDSGLVSETQVNHLPLLLSRLDDRKSDGVSSGIPLFANLASTTALTASITDAKERFSLDPFDDDDDGFGLTGIINQPQQQQQQQESTEPFLLEMESALSDPTSMPAFAISPLKAPLFQSFSSLESDEEQKNRLLRQIQFGRSLADLAKYVKQKCGSLSPETERLFEQSVSLLAYPSPSSPECPLRCLLDPSWRDNIASLINSAILTEAHHLPPQPAIEQALYALQKCFTNPEFQEAQVLGHFLLYHLSPSKYTSEIRLQQSAPSPFSSQALASFHSSQSSLEQQEAALLFNNNNNSASSERISNGCEDPPKRHLCTPPSSNGASRRHWRRRRVPSANAAPGSRMRYALAEALPLTDEEEAGGISIEEAGQLHRHVELEDDHEEGESLDEEAEVELMTATMGEENVGLNVGEDEGEDNNDDDEEEVDEETEELTPQRAMFSTSSTEGRSLRRLSGNRKDWKYSSSYMWPRFQTNSAMFLPFVPSQPAPVGDNSASESRSLALASASSPGRRGESFDTYVSEVPRLSVIRPSDHSHLFIGSRRTSGSGVRVIPSSRSSRRSGHALTHHSSANNNNNNNNNQ